MAELSSQKRKSLPDSAFAVVTTENGKKVRKYPVYDEAHQEAALKMSHGARSGKPASASEHKAVHAAVGSRNKELLANHMKEHHGSGMVKRAFDGVVSRVRDLASQRRPREGPSPAQAALEHANPRARFLRTENPSERVKVPRPKSMPRMAKGGIAMAATDEHGKWVVVNKQTKAQIGSYKDRDTAAGAIMQAIESEPGALDDLRVMQVFNARDLVKDRMASRLY